MAKKNKNEVAGPEPLPKAGDTVNYIWPPDGSAPAIAGTARRAKVTAVYDGLEGRVVDLDVDSGDGVKAVKAAPWRDDEAGNTWHWPMEAAAE